MFLRLLCLIGILFFINTSGTAQQKERQAISSKLHLAKELERLERLEEAKSLYEILYNQAPDNVTVFNRLRNLYLRIQAYEQALELIEERKRRHPHDSNLEIAAAHVCYKMGKHEEAVTRWNKILDQKPKQASIYQGIASVMIQERLLDEAIDVYLLGRRRIGKDDLYVFNLANLYAARMDYGEAAEELLRYLEMNPKQVSLVETHLFKYSKTKGAIREIENKLKKAISSRPNDLNLRRIMVSFYIKANRYKEGLKATRELEQLIEEKKQGEALFRFGREVFRSGASEEAVNAYMEILAVYPRFSRRDQVVFGLAQCYEAQRKLKDAVTAYQMIIDDLESSQLGSQSLYRKGMIEKDDLFDLERAEETFRMLLEKFPSSRESTVGRLELGSCYVAQGDLDKAEAIFRKVLNQSDKKKDGNWVRSLIHLADVAYLRGRFDEALSLLKEISAAGKTANVTENPALNDGLRLRLFLEEYFHRCPELLTLFANGDFWIRQRLFNRALAVLDSLITGWPEEPINAEALFMKGEAEIQLGRFRHGLSSFDTLLDRFPTSLLADQAVERTGWIYEKMGEEEKALRQYELLLVTYPQSFLIDEIRQRIREIEKEK